MTTKRSARALAHDLQVACHRARARALAHDLEVACHRARAFDFDLARARARDLARDLDLALARIIGDAAREAGELEQLLASVAAPAVPTSRNTAVRPQRVCRGLVAVAARMVPAGHRARYEQEWRAELWELGEQPRPRRHQLGHAIRVLTRCVALRRGLTRPVPGRAAGGGSAEG